MFKAGHFTMLIWVLKVIGLSKSSIYKGRILKVVVINYGEGATEGVQTVLPCLEGRGAQQVSDFPINGGNVLPPPPFSMAKTSSFHVKTNSRLIASPQLKHVLSPFIGGVKLHLALPPPVLRFCNPPPPLSP